MFISLSIAEPCHQNWGNMLPEQQGKFCLSCQKKVTDFTNMTDAEMLTYFTQSKGNTCGRFTDDQLERRIAEPKKHSIGKWKYFWQILIPVMFGVYRSEAQTTKGEVATTICIDKSKLVQPVLMGDVVVYRPVNYSLQIIDETGQAIPFATVHFKSKNLMLSADAMGRFKVTTHLNETVEISSIGFVTKTVDFQTLEKNKLVIVLQKQLVNLPDIKVIGYGTTMGKMVAGGVSIVRHKSLISLFTKKKDLIPVLPEPSIKIFPNPIRANQSFKVALSVNKLDRYLLQIIDVAGHVIKEQFIDMQMLQQTETIEGAGFQHSGVYIIHLVNSEKKNVFNGKLVVG